MALIAFEDFDFGAAYGTTGTIESKQPKFVRLTSNSSSVTPTRTVRGPLTSGLTSLYRYDLSGITYDENYRVYTVLYNAGGAHGDGAGVVVRLQDANTYYHARYNKATNAIELYRFRSGATLLGSYPVAFANSAQSFITLQAVGSQIDVFWGFDFDNPVISVLDPDPISAKGSPGFRIYPDGASDNSGLHLRTYFWVDSVEPPAPTTNPPAAYTYLKLQGIL